MKVTSVAITSMFLASIMILSVGTSYAQYSNVTASSPGVQTMSNQTNSNMTMSSNSTSADMNQTMTSTNSTMPASVNGTTPSANSTAPNDNDTQAAQQVSDFIHQAVADFKQQGIETRQAIFDCRDKIQTASPNDIQGIKDVCATNLNAIKAKYQSERSHYHDLVKQYRQSVMVFLSDARGHSVGKSAMDSAFADLAMKMHESMSPGHAMGNAATVNNTKCVNPPGGPAIC